MKIIFLNIDGVLNSEIYYRSVDRTVKDWARFDPKVVDLIKKLIDEFSAKIVIPSTWRFGAKKELSAELKAGQLFKFLHADWKTPVIEPGHRGKKIKMWLDAHPDVKEFVILDDDDDILEEHRSRFVRTDYYDGMQPEHYYRAREILET